MWHWVRNHGWAEEKTMKKKKVNPKRVLFILFCITVPVINWLVTYVYVNLDAFTMAFTDRTGAFTLENFVRFWNEMQNRDSDIRTAFRNTFLTFGVIMLLFPTQILVSYFIYKKIPGSGIYRIVFFLPSIIFSVALSMIFMRIVGVNGVVAQTVQRALGLDYVPDLLADSRFANITVLLHMVWLGIPGDLIIWGGTFARIPEEVLESGKIDGVNWWQEFTKITVPLVWPTVALKMVLNCCAVFGSSGAVFLLTKGNYGTMTLTAWMYLQIYNNTGTHETSNVYNYMSAVGLVLTVIAVSISVIIRRWADKTFEEVEY